MKTLLVTIEYPPFFGGVANYYYNIVKHWPEGDACGSDHGIMVLDNNQGQLLSDSLLFFKWIPGIFRIMRTVRKHGIDKLIIGHLLPLGNAAYFATRIVKRPYAVVLHGMDLETAKLKPRKRKLSYKILKEASGIICSNSYAAKSVKDFLGTEEEYKVRIVNPGIDDRDMISGHQIEKFRQEQGVPDGTLIFTIARIVKRKGIDKVVEAMPAVLKVSPGCRYVIAGIGPDERYIEEKIAALPEEARRRVRMIGKITDAEKWLWLRACDIFAMPSRQIGNDVEGFGIVLMEASLAGRPVVAGDSGGVRDAVENNTSGFLVDPEKTEAIANAIVRLAEDTALRRRLGEQGRKRALDSFRWREKVIEIHRIISGMQLPLVKE